LSFDTVVAAAAAFLVSVSLDSSELDSRRTTYIYNIQYNVSRLSLSASEYPAYVICHSGYLELDQD